MWRIIFLIEAFMGVIVTCMTEEDPFKMRALEWSQKIFHCKSMQIFYNTQGQLTQQSEVIST